jgi:hypothetical protein
VLSNPPLVRTMPGRGAARAPAVLSGPVLLGMTGDYTIERIARSHGGP